MLRIPPMTLLLCVGLAWAGEAGTVVFRFVCVAPKDKIDEQTLAEFDAFIRATQIAG